MCKYLVTLLLLIGTLDVINTWRLQCSQPRIDNGNIKSKVKLSMVRFTCAPGYFLRGKRVRYCHNKKWDGPPPVCVQWSRKCQPSLITNAVVIPSLNFAYLNVYCHPGYKLNGPSEVYCNGKSWNAPFPTCVEAKNTTSALSCDFETEDICGWRQDEKHDFDWQRRNRETPSHYMLSGPSADHTLGNENGYYMYLDSSGLLSNASARLISPVYDKAFAADGCFTLYYHMFGKNIGGLRVFQKPENVSIEVFRSNTTNKNMYLLFEKWFNQGNDWFGQTSILTNYDEDFQIIIEAITLGSLTSDIAIDDVAIDEGEYNCSMLINQTNQIVNQHRSSCYIPDMCPDNYTCEERGDMVMCVANNTKQIECAAGYEWIKGGCVDINECETETHNCTGGRVCKNTEGSHICMCDYRHFYYDPQTDNCLLLQSCWSRCGTTSDVPAGRCGCDSIDYGFRRSCVDYLFYCGNNDFRDSATDQPETEKLVGVSTRLTFPAIVTQTTASTATSSSTTLKTTTPTTTTVKPTTSTTTTTTPKPTTTSSTTQKSFTLSFKTSTDKPIEFKTIKTTTDKAMELKTVKTSTKQVVTTSRPGSGIPSASTTRAAHGTPTIAARPTARLSTTNNPPTKGYMSIGIICVSVLAALSCCAGALWLAASSRSAAGINMIVRLRARATNDPEVRFITKEDDD